MCVGMSTAPRSVIEKSALLTLRRLQSLVCTCFGLAKALERINYRMWSTNTKSLSFEASAQAVGRRAGLWILAPLLFWITVTTSSGVAQEAMKSNSVTSNAKSQSRFMRTVVGLQDAAPEWRSEFAIAALSHLAKAYATEAELARSDANARGWSGTVDRYASEIPLLLDDVTMGLPVSLSFEADESLAISVGGRTVILSHPRLSQQDALEQSILKEYCAQQECGEEISRQGAHDPIPASVTTVRPTWNFTELGSSCSEQGITVNFQSNQNMKHARVICEQFLQEVMALAGELASQRRHAVELQWEQMAIQSIAGSPEHLVKLNTLGDSIILTAPMLFASPGVLRQVLPWVQQRLENHTAPTLEVDAAAEGWQRP